MRWLLLLPVLSLTNCLELAAQQWTLRPMPVAPAPTIGAAMAYDVLRDRTILFGGQAQLTGWPIQFFDDTWLFDGTTWTNANPSVHPPARAHHNLTADDSGNVLLFGGIDPNGTPLKDLWRWDGNTWSQIVTNWAIPPRHSAAMASYGAGCLVFGGYDPLTNTYLGDTWLWEPSSNWTQWTSGPSPSPRRGAGMVEVINLNVILHGGHNAGPLADTWRWNNGTWTSLPQAAGPARSSFAIGYDPSNQQTFLSGGHYASTPTGFADDLWRFDGQVWRDITPATHPSQVIHAATTLDVTRHRLMVFGGTGGITASNEHWDYDGTFPVLYFGSGCAVSGPTPTLTTSSAAIGGLLLTSIYGNGATVPVALFAIGFSNQNWNGVPLPLSLASLGLNCDLLVEPFSIELRSRGPSASGFTTFAPIPDAAVLIGTDLFLQGGVLNAAGFRGVTNAARCRIF